ncbi:alpha-glucoside transport system substrate-binding protein [Nocardioides sp. BE266]|uniref:ABC transporter substrate-binding protein n=1 Tax=Nocardioides sp. BE266 TaxID=2817725 RepID=UPI0028545D6E|nr:ABC transporter substrate-binding protein [Nocardioides sp. BE266]MDR7252561.1 alpha-glucoside transport system substrate-binding protein [Nocardioides sp. BE266]
MRLTSTRRRAALAVTAAALALTTTGCLGDSGGGGGGDSNTVTVWMSVDQPIVDGFQEHLDKLAADTDLTVKLEKVENINQLIMTKIQANDTPDIALIPQPGVVGDIVDRGAAFPLDDVVDVPALEQSMIPGTLDTGTFDGKLYGLLAQMNVKSLVFYNKAAWDKAGYKAPESIDELNALTEQIKADGGTPWCMGIESDTATGWPATDWFEDLVLRYGGVDTYDQWVSHEVPFDSDVVRESAAEFEKLMFTDGNVLGGRKSISSTGFADAGYPMFDKSGPKCWLFKQGSFIPSFITEGAGVTLDDIGLFGFPPAEAGGDNPLLGGGDLAVLLNDSDQAKQVMKWMSDPELGTEAAPKSSFISPHTTFDTSLYPDALTAQMAQIAYDATDFRFDGSDQMPGEVGAGTFWKEMTAWISDDQDLDTTLKNIDDSWPSS